MSNKRIWMVRAGEKAAFVDDFVDEKFVAIGWKEVGELQNKVNKAELEESLSAKRPKESPGTISNWASQIKRYYEEVNIGDSVTTYDPNQRLYFIGEVLSTIEMKTHALCRARKVKWTHQVPRDVLLTSTRNSLGSIGTLFLIKGQAAADMWKHAVAIGTPSDDSEGDNVPLPVPADEDAILIQEVTAKSIEFIEDRIAKLGWEQMQELVKEILLAMGYRARVSPKGADRGVDVFASPDGLGLQEPRIFVEVKHRLGTQISSGQIRSFIGGRQPGDRCLYVSTGGFSKDARYEAERSTIPLTLISLPQLGELVVENYESFTPSGKALLPLERLYWPAL
ncbi:MAG: restriction endonuclease [bacterium]|nr:restriction endonuclease [bacterium]